MHLVRMSEPEKPTPDFDPNEISSVQARLVQRYGKEVALQQVEVEVPVDPAGAQLSWRPALYWSEGGASFVVLKLGEGRYRPLFFYRPNQQFGTGRDSYPDLGECVTTVLRVQSDHAREMAGIASGSTGKDLH